MTPRLPELFWRFLLRPLPAHPLITAMNILCVALGVTVFLAIQLANRAALESFENAAALTTGRADLEIRGDIPEEVFPLVANAPGVRSATPLVEGVVTLPAKPGGYLRVLGTDPFTGAEFRAFTLDGLPGEAFDLERWLGDREAVAVTPDTLSDLLTLADAEGRIQVGSSAGSSMLRPRFLLEPDGLATADRRVVAMDIAWAQELLDRVGFLSSIQVATDDPVEVVAKRLEAILPDDLTVAPPALRTSELQTMLGAFQLNLTALSLVSVVVGMFLIYNGVAASVVRRRMEIAVLRANGVTSGEVRALFLGESLIAGVLGVALGIAAAPWLAAILARPMATTVSSLYTLVTVDAAPLRLWQVVQAVAVGLTASLAAAWVPASEAANLDPKRLLHPGAARETVPATPSAFALWGVAALVLAVASGWWAIEGGPDVLGFASAAFVLAGFTTFVPGAIAVIGSCVRPPVTTLRLAADQFLRSSARNAITIAALAAAVAMLISIVVMIFSFRASVVRWVERTLVADLYLAPALNDTAGLQEFLPANAVDWLRDQPEVAEVGTFREQIVRVQNEPSALAVIDGRARGELEFLSAVVPDPQDALERGEVVVVSESFSNRFGLRAGETLNLATPAGPFEALIAGVFRDYTRDRGTAMIHRSFYEKFWPDPRIHSVSVVLNDPQSAPAVGERFTRHFDGLFAVYDNDALRQRVFEIFDQTFAITSALRVVAIVVAIFGVGFSLTVLVAEREREIGVLRAVGASRGQIAAIFLGEAALIALTAALVGMLSGSALALVLTGVINKAFFGWSIALSYPIASILVTPLWLIPAALAAATLPALRAAKTAPAEALRFE